MLVRFAAGGGFPLFIGQIYLFPQKREIPLTDVHCARKRKYPSADWRKGLSHVETAHAEGIAEDIGEQFHDGNALDFCYAAFPEQLGGMETLRTVPKYDA